MKFRSREEYALWWDAIKTILSAPQQRTATQFISIQDAAFQADQILEAFRERQL